MEYLFYAPGRGAHAVSRPPEGEVTRTQGFYQTLKEALAQAEGAGVGLQRLYERVAFMRRCVAMRAKTLASTPWSLYGRGERAVYDSMAQENPPAGLELLSTMASTLRHVEADLALSGWSFLLKEDGQEDPRAPRRRRITGLSWYAPHTMSIEPSKDITDGRLRSYTRTKQRADGMTIELTIPVDNLVIVRENDPYREAGRPSSDGQAAQDAASVIYHLNAFLSGHLAGGLLRDVLFSIRDVSGRGRLPHDVTTPENKLTQWLKRRRGDEKTAQIVSELLEVHELGEGFQHLDNEPLIEAARQDVAAAFGVPYSLVQSAAANYATKLSDKLDLYEQALFADMDLIEEAFNVHLFNPMGYTFQFEKALVEAVQYAEVQKAQALQVLTAGAPILTADEAREQLGYDPLGGESAEPEQESMPREMRSDGSISYVRNGKPPVALPPGF